MFTWSPPRRRLLSPLLLALIGASAIAATDPPLVWRGDITTARSVVDDVAKAWRSSGHGPVELQPFNTVSGIDAVASGSADIAGSARGEAPGRSNESGLTFTPVAWDALVMITHPGNPVHNISLKQLHDIYFGKITNWSELGGRNEPIDLYAVASPSDGVEFSLRRLLYGRGNQPVAVPRLYVNVAKLEQAVTLDPKALGVSTLSGVRGNSQLQIIAIDDVMPSTATVASGRYQLYTPLYLVTNANGPNAVQTRKFVDFMNSPQARTVMRAHNLLPYNDGATLAAADGQRMAAIAAEVGRPAPSVSTPMAEPGASYASREAMAPASGRIAAAIGAGSAGYANPEARPLNANSASTSAPVPSAAAADSSTRTPPRASFAGVTGSADSSARPGFGTVTGSVLGKAIAQTSAAASYTVVHGDTLSSIARMHSVDVKQLRQWNDLDGNDLRVGQALRMRAR